MTNGRLASLGWQFGREEPEAGESHPQRCKPKEKGMAASGWVLECAAPACGDEFHASSGARDLWTVDEPEEMSTHAKTAASLAEFAHDLCSPLSALAIIARCLRDEGTPEGRDGDINSIIRISEHVLGIVQGVLDQARLEAASDIPRIATFDLQLLVGGVMDVIRPCARAKKLEFVVRRDRALPKYVRADASRLQRILINVLDNAVKYTEQGSVTLSLQLAEPQDPAQIWLIFEIRDTGIGITPRDQARIFERFSRGSGVDGTNGAGLGLSIASRLVHLMDGSIWIESEPGVGSTFHIELPVARALEAESPLPPAVREKANLSREDMAALPYELRAELRESVLALDVQRISATIERVAKHNAALGENLKLLARQYAFTVMFEAVEACNLEKQ